MSSQTLYLDGKYLAKNPGWHVEESPWKAKQVLRMLRQNHLAPTTVCDVGCGAGEVLNQLQKSLESQCTFWGYDISPQAFEMCKQRENERLHFKLADIRLEKDVFFDLILMLDVVEHVEDYFSFLRDIKPKAGFLCPWRKARTLNASGREAKISLFAPSVSPGQ